MLGTLKIKLQRPLVDAIIANIAGGNTYKAACGLTGVAMSTFFKWTKTGRELRDAILSDKRETDEPLSDHERLCLDLVEGIEKAEGQAEKFCIDIILKKAETSWQAAAWWLERRRPQDYGRRMYVTSETAEAEPIKTPSEIAVEMDASIGGALEVKGATA